MCQKVSKAPHLSTSVCAWSKTSEEALPTSQNNLLDIKRGCFEKFLRRWLYFAEVKTQMKYYVCKFCANSATPKYFSFLEHFSENILHSTSLMRNTFLSSYQFPPENTIRRIFHNISVRVATRLCGCAQPARFLCDGSRLSIAPQKIGSTIRKREVWHGGHNRTCGSAVLCQLLKNFWWLRMTLSWSAQFEIFLVAGRPTSELNFSKTSV